jgi:hypothetical protein
MKTIIALIKMIPVAIAAIIMLILGLSLYYTLYGLHIINFKKKKGSV